MIPAMKKTTILLLLLSLACSTPQTGPDKTIGGAILGAGWGAGAGAVVGNQVMDNAPGEGAAIGAGFGLLSGALQGAGYDALEETQIEHENKLAALEIQNAANSQQLARIQAELDNAPEAVLGAKVYSVYFDPDATNLKAGSVRNLEKMADAIIQSSRVAYVNVAGHTDDTGDDSYNRKLALARAENVAAYLMGRGISNDQINVKSFGAENPVTTNTTPEGRQINRRVEVSVMLN